MIGIPIDLYPSFPTDANPVLLTESAKYDPQNVDEIKGQLRAEKNVVITSGLLHAVQGEGIEDIVELRYSGHKAIVDEYFGAFGAGSGTGLGETKNAGVAIPEIALLTNDAWPLVRGIANGTGYPILLMDRYSEGARTIAR
jgi:hypothetical protein